MFVILFYANLYAFLGEGPLWYTNQLRTKCDDYWWTNLLYINNFYPKSLQDEVRCRFSFIEVKLSLTQITDVIDKSNRDKANFSPGKLLA